MARGRKPVTRREHGTRRCYLRGPGPGTGPGCRCGDCQAASYRAKIQRELAILRGEWHPFVDAQPARARVQQLQAGGLSLYSIAAMAGVRPNTLVHLTGGTQGSKPAGRIRPETEAAILGLRVSRRSIPGRAMVDAAGAQRRIQALIALGWTRSQLAQRLGVKDTNLGTMLSRTHVRAATAMAVHGLYDSLWATLPPEDTPLQAKWARLSREDAAARGWPPLLAWDDGQLDRPDGRPARSWIRAQTRRQLEAAGEPETDIDIEAG